MAKEMMIVFVYDSELCSAEDDDPADAVLYFHPNWVSVTQRHALCGQVVGAAHCIKSLFSQPVAITLQSGKFIIREYGRYILAIGSDRNIPDWVLKNRAGLLTSMIKVYHGDLDTVAAQFQGDSKRFSEKLYQMLETYLPVLQYGCHIFQRVPMLSLPKSATSIYMETMQILEYCQTIKGVLGGVILYNNKIVASQLSPSLTSYLTVVDPYRVKSPAESLHTEVPLPLGSQLLVVYVPSNTYERLKKKAQVLQDFAQHPEQLVNGFKKNQEAEREKQAREFPQTGMKRDKSLLFTAVPEEDHSLISPPTRDHLLKDQEEGKDQGKTSSMPDVVPFTNRPRQRPNKLSLSFKTQASVDEEGKENDAVVFTGQTSVCSTPMVEYKRLHGNVLSICQNPDKEIPSEPTIENNDEPDVLKNLENNAKTKLKETERKDNKILLEMNTIGDYYINKPDSPRKLGSVNDIQDTIKRFSNRASAKFKLKRSKIVLSDDITPSPENQEETVLNMTINDPSFPVFRNDGVAISESLFKEYLERHYAMLNEQDMSKAENMFTFHMKMCEQDKIEGFDSDFSKSPQRTPKKQPKEVKTTKTDQSRRKSLSLPIKSLTDSVDTVSEQSEMTSFGVKKKLTGVQLTPLMEKLSHLAFSDKSSGYSSRVMTPLEIRDFSTPAQEKQITFSDKAKLNRSDSSESEKDEDLEILAEYSRHAVRTALFISGLQNMALMVLLDIQASSCPDTINTLWETSLNTLGSIEQKCMEPLPTSNEATEYSYLTLDPEWGTAAKGGPWPPLDIATMGLEHSEFAQDPELSEIILRTEDSVVLGVSCGGAEVYYQENGARQPGLPGPSDALATVSLKAKRRLHRDHSVVIL